MFPPTGVSFTSAQESPTSPHSRRKRCRVKPVCAVPKLGNTDQGPERAGRRCPGCCGGFGGFGVQSTASLIPQASADSLASEHGKHGGLAGEHGPHSTSLRLQHGNLFQAGAARTWPAWVDEKITSWLLHTPSLHQEQSWLPAV